MSDVLSKILARKREEVQARSQSLPLATLEKRCAEAPAPRGFYSALAAARQAGQAGVIAEIKKASPSKGVIREGFDPAAHARSYAQGGATCLSVLTDHDFFQGQEGDLLAARGACALPVLRKDFTIDPWQLYEARDLGADCVLLIVAALDQPTLKALHEEARSLALDVLVEVHDAEELDRALELEPQLLGINNRNLHTFETRLETSLTLRARIPADSEAILVTESGIQTREDIQRMLAADLHAFLIGETFMRAPDPGAALRSLFRP